MTDEPKPETTLSRRDETAIAPQSLTPAEMLSIAVQQGADTDKLEKLMDLQERWQKDQARKAYAEAIVQFRSVCPTIVRTGTADYGKGKAAYTYAQLPQAVEQIQTLLQQCQLAVTWATPKQTPTWIEVTCTVTHVLGHSESTTLGGPPDASGSKNQLQAIKSTWSYLRRTTLFSLLGLVDKDEVDDDGAGGKPTDEKKPATQELLDADPDDRAAKARFREVANQRAAAVLPNGALHKLLAAVREASGEQDVATCVRWLEENDVQVGTDGSLAVVTEDPSAFDEPLTAEDAAAAGGVIMCNKGHTIPRADIVPSTLVNRRKGELGLCPVCKKVGTATIVKEKRRGTRLC